MIYLPPFVIPRALRIKEKEEISGFSAVYRRMVEELRDGRFELSRLQQLNYYNEALEEISSEASFYGN